MVLKNQNLEHLCVVKADSVQGLEFEVTVTDLTIGKTAGFLNLMNRLVASISRANVSSNLVIDKSAVYGAKSRTIKRVCAEYLQLGTRSRVADDTPSGNIRESEFCNEGMMDFENAKTAEQVLDVNIEGFNEHAEQLKVVQITAEELRRMSVALKAANVVLEHCLLRSFMVDFMRSMRANDEGLPGLARRMFKVALALNQHRHLSRGTLSVLKRSSPQRWIKKRWP
ncbi:hypothetical protein A1O3_00820 [Capronia epimyces CBS 606.96]|uniref:Uncharacterized protein n=1 Tax=Capronia epimyces CBS 606.96 TaxID=1182542 RepID=W9YRG1_9EURO|nr:uncharacterized protein A1O3_00820 [Capronia epimyces CBS 606.96]EXJ92270.1 hypothetical protein A1O3_00820 [Capronia epimyces CBS 606.96]